MELPFDEISTPSLLRGARGAYLRAINKELSGAGLSSLPAGGGYVLGGLRAGLALSPLLDDVTRSDEQRHRLVETLSGAGYLVHDVSDDSWRLSPRGESAAACVSAGVTNVDSLLVARLGEDGHHALRVGLAVLHEIRHELI